jgi:hypothetical protein
MDVLLGFGRERGRFAEGPGVRRRVPRAGDDACQKI